MAIRQTRIFVSASEDQFWAECLLGRVFRPIASEFADSLEWFWFSRYAFEIDGADEEHCDCDFKEIPDSFKRTAPGLHGHRHRSLRFRFEVQDRNQAACEGRLAALIAEHGYSISDIRDYKDVADTGSSRHLGVENRQPGRNIRRSRLISELYCSICRLALDALVESDLATHRFQFEHNDDKENFFGSTFETIHHMLCNITRVPVPVLLDGADIICPEASLIWPPLIQHPMKATRKDGRTGAVMFLRY